MYGRREGDKAGEVGRSRIMETGKFGFYLEDAGYCEPLKDLKPG